MTPTPFHLGWFMNFTPDEWNKPFGAGGQPWNGEFYIEMAQALERACFDYIMIEDTLMVSDAYGGTHRGVPEARASWCRSTIRRRWPRSWRDHDEAGRGRDHVDHGLPAVPAGPAVHDARPHLPRAASAGTSSPSGEDRAAQNFGLDKLPPRELRYDMADEYVELVCQLWDSWEPGRGRARPRDRHLRGLHQGAADQLRGQVLQVPRAAEHRAARRRAARRSCRRAARRRAASSRPRRRHDHRAVDRHRGHEGLPRRRPRPGRGHGRNPDDIKVLFVVAPVLGDDRGRGVARKSRPHLASARSYIEQALAEHLSVTDIDFSQFDLDKPLPPPDDQRRAGLARQVRAVGQRQDAAPAGAGRGRARPRSSWSARPTRSPTQMGEVDGGGRRRRLPHHAAHDAVSRQYITEISDGLVPALQRRGPGPHRVHARAPARHAPGVLTGAGQPAARRRAMAEKATRSPR